MPASRRSLARLLSLLLLATWPATSASPAGSSSWLSLRATPYDVVSLRLPDRWKSEVNQRSDGVVQEVRITPGDDSAAQIVLRFGEAWRHTRVQELLDPNPARRLLEERLRPGWQGEPPVVHTHEGERLRSYAVDVAGASFERAFPGHADHRTARLGWVDAGGLVFSFAVLEKEESRELREEVDQVLRSLLTDPSPVVEALGLSALGRDADAFAAMEKLARAGDPEAAAWMGEFYAQGVWVGKNEAEALSWSRKSAEAGNAHGLYGLGSHFQNGVGVAADLDRARHYYEQAAAQRYSRATYRLAFMYYRGEGVPKDAARAFEYMRDAALQGDPDALLPVAEMYHHGLGVEPDPEQAVRFYAAAAAIGDARALERLSQYDDESAEQLLSPAAVDD